MIVKLKEPIPCNQVISRNNNYRNYLNERQGTHLIFYLSERAPIRGGGGGEGVVVVNKVVGHVNVVGHDFEHVITDWS